MAQRLGTIVTVAARIALVVLYPLIVWWAFSTLALRMASIVVLAAALPIMAWRLRKASALDTATRWRVLRLPLVFALAMGIGMVLRDSRYARLAPVLLNLALFAEFASSLRDVPMIERFARMQDPELTLPKQSHCRQFTVVWAIFLLLNASVTALLAWFGEIRAWAVYTGGIAYLLMGLLFAAEYIVRKARFREYGVWPHDRLLRRVFPPREGVAYGE